MEFKCDKVLSEIDNFDSFIPKLAETTFTKTIEKIQMKKHIPTSRARQ